MSETKNYTDIFPKNFLVIQHDAYNVLECIVVFPVFVVLQLFQIHYKLFILDKMMADFLTIIMISDSWVGF